MIKYAFKDAKRNLVDEIMTNPVKWQVYQSDDVQEAFRGDRCIGMSHTPGKLEFHEGVYSSGADLIMQQLLITQGILYLGVNDDAARKIGKTLRGVSPTRDFGSQAQIVNDKVLTDRANPKGYTIFLKGRGHFRAEVSGEYGVWLMNTAKGIHFCRSHIEEFNVNPLRRDIYSTQEGVVYLGISGNAAADVEKIVKEGSSNNFGDVAQSAHIVLLSEYLSRTPKEDLPAIL